MYTSTRHVTEDLLQSVDVLVDGRHWVPALMVIYGTIDVLSGLARPASKPEATREDFIAWVDKYLLPRSYLGCSAVDLYSARCAVLHSYSARSRLTRTKVARSIAYSVEFDGVLATREDLRGATDEPVINIHLLHAALVRAVRTFREALVADRVLGSLARQRANLFLKPERASSRGAGRRTMQ